MKVWRNGQIIESAAAIDAQDRGVLLGDGLFETLAVMERVPLRLGRHLSRLRQGADALGIPLPHDGAGISEAITTLLEAENVDEGSVRITLLRGPAPRGVLPPQGVSPTLVMSAFAGKIGMAEPVRMVVAATTRRNEFSPLAAVKSTNYLDSIIGAREAGACGADDAVMLNTQGHVAEAAWANIFCRMGDVLATPPIVDGALPGIMRACVMESETVREQSLRADDLYAADEVFLTSSLSIRPVVEIDGHVIGNGAPGPVAARLSDLPRRAR